MAIERGEIYFVNLNPVESQEESEESRVCSSQLPLVIIKNFDVIGLVVMPESIADVGAALSKNESDCSQKTYHAATM